eukprot:2919209-Rhodomonas_salina.1
MFQSSVQASSTTMLDPSTRSSMAQTSTGHSLCQYRTSHSVHPEVQYKKPPFPVQFVPGMRFLVFYFGVYGIVKHKKPHFQYSLYQECGFSCLISGCRGAGYLFDCGCAPAGSICYVSTAHRQAAYDMPVLHTCGRAEPPAAAALPW